MLRIEWEAVVGGALIELYQNYGIHTVNELQLMEYEKAIYANLESRGIPANYEFPYSIIKENFKIRYMALFTFDEELPYTEYCLKSNITDVILENCMMQYIPIEIMEALQSDEVKTSLLTKKNCHTCALFCEGKCPSIKKNLCDGYQYGEDYLEEKNLGEKFCKKMEHFPITYQYFLKNRKE